MSDGGTFSCPTDLSTALGFKSGNSVGDFKAAQCTGGWNWVVWQAGLNNDNTLRNVFIQFCCSFGQTYAAMIAPSSTVCQQTVLVMAGVQDYGPPKFSPLYPAASDTFWGFTGYTAYLNAGSITGLTLYKTGFATDTTETVGVTTGVSVTYMCAQGSLLYGLWYITGGVGISSIAGVCKAKKCSTTANQYVAGCGCSAGTYYSAGANACVACPVGGYSKNDFATTCAACTVGGTTGVTYTSNGGTTDSCSYNCNAGYGFSGAACVGCTPGYYKGAADKSVCVQCRPGTYADGTGTVACTGCPAGKYQPNYAGATCFDCIRVNPAQGYYTLDCTPTSTYGSSQCTTCAPGYILNPPCNPSSTTVPACQACPPGTHQSFSIPGGYAGTPYVCQQCPPGTYSASSGAAGCLGCSRQLPSNGNWAPWASPVSDACPFQCNAGYQKDGAGTGCVACQPGKYTPTAAGGQTCVACTLSLVNGYWLRPVLFNASWNGCPWDCNAGYYANVRYGNCIPCPAESFARVGLQRADDTQVANVCLGCSKCVQGTYESVACTPLTNRECATCQIACSPGYFVRPCNMTADRTCVTCKTRCTSGQFMTGVCTGLDTQDTIGCQNCSGPGICDLGKTYMPTGQCPGNKRANAGCVVCSQVSCPFGTYQVACTQSVDTTCVAYTQCTPGVTTLRGRGLFNNGTACF